MLILSVAAWCGAGRGTAAPPIGDPAALAAALTNRTTVLEVRKQKLQTLLQSPEGANAVLQLAEADVLPFDLRLQATMALNAANWPAIKERAATLLPMPLSQNSVPLPPLAELVKLPGNPANGAAIFAKPDVNCINCHLVQGKGVEIGPDLSDVGNRLKKDELFENILEPNAIITKDYEAWQVILNDDDEACGLMVAETKEGVTLKDLKGKITVYKRSDIRKTQRLNVSIMPLGLQQAMTAQELADVVAYLSTLKLNKPK